MEPINSPRPLGISSLHTTMMTQTHSPEHSSVNTQMEIPTYLPLNTNGYWYAHSPGQSESAMTEYGEHPTIRIQIRVIVGKTSSCADWQIITHHPYS